MRVQDQLISPRYGGPIIGGLRDFITGAYLLTKDDTILSKQDFCNLAMLGAYQGDLPEPASSLCGTCRFISSPSKSAL